MRDWVFKPYFWVWCGVSGHVETKIGPNGAVWATPRRFEGACVVWEHGFSGTWWNDACEVAGM